MKSWPKMKLGQVGVSHNLVVSTLKWPQYIILSILSIIYLYLPPPPYLNLFIIIYLYLVLFALNCHDFTTCAIVSLHRYYSIETMIDNAFQIIGRCRKCRHKYSLHIYLVIDNFVYVALVFYDCIVKAILCM